MFRKLAIAVLSCLIFSNIQAGEFSVSSYNCGGLSDHYDYIRAASMQKLMQSRYTAEPQAMARIERIQQLALKALFAKNFADQEHARAALADQKAFFEKMISAPNEPESPNAIWFQQSEAIVTPYDIRPIDLHDQEVSRMLTEHLQDIARTNNTDAPTLLMEGRHIMAERIFRDQLKYDILCLQEADYLHPGMFPDHYEVAFSGTEHSVNGIAWNKDRFELKSTVGDVLGRAFAVQLLEKASGKTVLVGTGHITGCNPFITVENPETQEPDSAKGDHELETITQLFDDLSADFKVIAMDSNVTATHPRLKILQEHGYQLDSENYFEQTCTNPYVVLNTRIDWIALKTNNANATITNVPVLGVGLNNIQNNISDHKPIAALVEF